MEGIGIFRFTASIAIVLLIVLIPLLLCVVPPLHDYPFHLARADILHSLPMSPFLRAHYRQGSFLLPDVGLDVVMIPLTRMLPILVAGRVLLGIILVVMLTGTVALHASLFRRLSIWPLISAFFLYNWIFLYGFLNYLLGVGLMLWGVAGWIALRERRPAAALVWSGLMALVLLACHLEALGLFAVAIAGIELQRGWSMLGRNPLTAIRDVAVAAMPFVVALVVFVALSPTAGEVTQTIAYHGGRGWKPLVAYRTLLTTLGPIDLLMLAPLAVGVVWAVWRQYLHLATSMIMTLVLLAVTFMVMPFDLFGSQFGDARLPIAILLVLIASTQVTGLSRRVGLVLGTGALALLMARTAIITRDWREADVRIAAFTRSYSLLPDGITLYVATTQPFPTIDYRNAKGLALWHPPLKHIVSLASLGRDIFVPSTWSDPYKQPMLVAPAWDATKTLQGNNPFKTPTAADLASVIDRIHQLHQSNAAPDYLLLLYPDELGGALPNELTILARDHDFVLARLPP